LSRPSTSLCATEKKTWMPGSADKFTQSAQAWLRAGHDVKIQDRYDHSGPA
jgi:hypothetical protein